MTAAPTTTTLKGSVITDAPVTRIVGPHNDSSDFYGIGLGLVAIILAVALTRLIFRGRRDSTQVEGPR